MKKLLLVLTLPLSLFSHMEEATVVSGSAEFHQATPTHLEIVTQNATIIDCKQFHIPENHTVTITQPSSKSKMLSRVRGPNPSEILGKLESNGKVFLINPHGIFFGPNCEVNVGSLIASTLDIANEDFKKGTFRFHLSSDAKNSQIFNQGVLTASLEGEIALLAPHIINKGLINAKAGKIGLFSAPLVTLDLTGDQLMSFAVEGELEQGIITHLGKIAAEEGDVYLRLSTAKQVIENVVNTDGLSKGISLMKEGDVIRLVDRSEILAKNVSIAGKNVDLAGEIHSSFLSTDTEQTHLKTSVYAKEGMAFKGSVSVESPAIVLHTEGKRGIALHGPLKLHGKLALTAPEGLVVLNKVEGTAPLDVTGKRIDVNQPIKIKAPITFNGKTYLYSNVIASKNNLIFKGPVMSCGNGPITVGTESLGKGDVIFDGPVNGEGPYRNLGVWAGDGSIKFKAPIGEESPLEALKIIGKVIEVHDIGGEKRGVLKELNIRASSKGSIDLTGDVYNAGEQKWEGNTFNVGKPIQIISNDHFVEIVGRVNLKENAVLRINTGSEMLSFHEIQTAKGSSIFLAGGDVKLGEIWGEMVPLHVQAKEIDINGSIQASNIFMEAEGDIINNISSNKITSKGDIYLSSKKGSIGYRANDTDLSKSRLYVCSDQKIYVGSSHTVNLEGDSIDKILHPIVGNEPLTMIFNDVRSYQFMGEFFEDLEELISSLAPHLFSRKREGYVDTTIVNPRPAPLYYKP